MKIVRILYNNSFSVPSGRVRHIKGLFDDPICSVEDRIHEQQLVSAPGGDDFGNPYCPPGSSRYSANAMKGVPAVGVGECINISTR